MSLPVRGKLTDAFGIFCEGARCCVIEVADSTENNRTNYSL